MSTNLQWFPTEVPLEDLAKIIVLMELDLLTPPLKPCGTLHGTERRRWDNYGGEKFLNYGCLGNNLFTIDWLNCGNDYGEDLDRMIESKQAKSKLYHECRNHSQNSAHFIQSSFSSRYRLAENTFPTIENNAFAFHPYKTNSLLVYEKNISVSHIRHLRKTFRLGPVTINIAQEKGNVRLHSTLNPETCRLRALQFQLY